MHCPLVSIQTPTSSWLLTIFSLLFNSLVASGQILDSEEVVSDTAGLKIEYAAEIQVDVDRPIQFVVDIGASGEMKMIHPKHFFIINGNAGVSFVGAQQILNGGTAHARYRPLHSKRIHPEIFAQGQWDAARGMLSRGLAGANCRFSVLQKSNVSLVGATGFFYEHERWNAANLEMENAVDKTHTNSLIKWNTYFRFVYRKSDSFMFKSTIFIQARPDALIRYPRLALLLGTTVNISDKFLLNIGWQLQYDFAPVIPIPNLYLQGSNGVGYTGETAIN